MTAINIILARDTDVFLTGWDIYAKLNNYPSEEGDGTFVGRLDIDPDETAALLAWDSPTTGTWRFGATTIYNGVPGKFMRLYPI